MSEHDTDGMRELWGTILLRLIADALWPTTSLHNNGSGVTALDQHSARQWLGGNDFRIVCALAGFEPECVIGRVRPLVDATAAEREAFLDKLGLAGGIKRARTMTRLQAFAARSAA